MDGYNCLDYDEDFVCYAICGDGMVVEDPNSPGWEECDLGALNGEGFGCNSDCEEEQYWDCDRVNP